MSQQQCITTYTFDELSNKAKETARDNWRIMGPPGDWWDIVYEDAKQVAKVMGIEIKDIFFSGFSSQGDGAQFVGSYAYKTDCDKAIREYAPQDTTLHRIADELVALQRANNFALLATVVSDGNYSHEYCTHISVENEDNEDVSHKIEKELSETLRAFMRWIYKQLEKEYDFQREDEQVNEVLSGSNCQYTEDGLLYKYPI